MEEYRVYLMRRNDLHKIGVSKWPAWRASLLAGAKNDIQVIHSFPSRNAHAVEAALHARFVYKRVRGEWFSLDEDDVRLICRVRRCDTREELPKSLRPRYAERTYTMRLTKKQFAEIRKRSLAGKRQVWQEVLLLVEQYLAGPPIPAGVVPVSIAPTLRKLYWTQKGRRRKKS